jgi:hypothetical protein
MTTYQQQPAYYRVTWTLNSPTDYTSVGGVTPFSSIQMNNMVAMTSTNTSPSLSNGEMILCNDYPIGPFSSSDTVSTIINAFNAMTQYTGVMAAQDFSGYITLQTINPVTEKIGLTDIVGTPIEKIGFPSSTFSLTNPTYGGSFTTLSNGNTVVINGVTITFTTAGGLNLAGAINTINLYTGSTEVVATQYANKIQLNSKSGSPIYFGTGSSSTSANLGFADNTAYGGNMTLAQAQAIEKGRMRWNGIISSVESILTPSLWGSIALTGSTTDGNSLPTTLSWTIGVNEPDMLVTVTTSAEPEGAGTTLYGAAALTRLIARALTGSWSENCKVYNNTLSVSGAYALRENSVAVQFLTAGPLDTLANIANIEGNLSVALINNA